METMKAIVCNGYGPPEHLRLADVPKPAPASGEVLVRIHATSVNDFDWSLVTGKPSLYRLIFGLRKPKLPIPGMELSGVVETVGSGVSAFQPGDRVYGDCSDHGWGSWAEYMVLPVDALRPMPEGMSFVDAAALPHAGLLAWQSLVEVGQMQKEARVLINGAGGGVGALAVQLAKALGAREVTGVDAEAKFASMRQLGFDRVLDYRKTDFARTGERYDLILDAKSTRAPRTVQKALNPDGIYVSVGGAVRRILQITLAERLFGKPVRMLALKPNQGLEQLHPFYAQGKLKPRIDGPYALEDLPQQLSYFGQARHKGKIVIKMP